MAAKKKKRRDPAELVGSAKKTGSWYDRLSDADVDYVDDVVSCMATESHVSIKSVANSLKKELDLDCCVDTIVYILKKML